MSAEIIEELAGIKNTNRIAGNQVLSWARRVEVHCSQRAKLESLKESKDNDMI